jgi:hypothetical protein
MFCIYSLTLAAQLHVWWITFERKLEQEKEGIKENRTP